MPTKKRPTGLSIVGKLARFRPKYVPCLALDFYTSVHYNGEGENELLPPCVLWSGGNAFWQFDQVFKVLPRPSCSAVAVVTLRS